MGYRAHTIIRHRDYGNTVFSDWEEFINKFIPEAEKDGIEVVGNDNQDFFEVEKTSYKSLLIIYQIMISRVNIYIKEIITRIKN